MKRFFLLLVLTASCAMGQATYIGLSQSSPVGSGVYALSGSPTAVVHHAQAGDSTTYWINSPSDYRGRCEFVSAAPGTNSGGGLFHAEIAWDVLANSNFEPHIRVSVSALPDPLPAANVDTWVLLSVAPLSTPIQLAGADLWIDHTSSSTVIFEMANFHTTGIEFEQLALTNIPVTFHNVDLYLQTIRYTLFSTGNPIETGDMHRMRPWNPNILCPDGNTSLSNWPAGYPSTAPPLICL